VVSGITRTNFYPNGDVVINNTVLFYINNYDGSLNWNTESKEMKFFSMNSLPENLMDRDLIKTYLEKVNEN
ncbi:MAG: DNA mismatch repair protein MutT, partial [Mycoplasmatota bacterium]